MRKASGLRNKYRDGGKSSYDKKGKAARKDNYGSWTNGIQTRTERINGRTVTYDNRTGEWR